MGHMGTNFFPIGVNFYLMRRIFLHIGLNCKIKFLPWLEFSLVGQIFTLRVPIFIVITEVWPRANRAMVTNNLTVIIDVVLIEG